jgi:uncharacterized membrane protein YfcA
MDIVGFALAAAVAFAASILGGLTGFGVGLILPVALAPLVGIAHIVPVMAVAMAMTNASRLFVFRAEVSRRAAPLLLLGAVPAGFAAAYVYTLLPERVIAVILGVFALAMIPTRRLLEGRGLDFGRGGYVALGGAYGALAGTTSGSGVLLIAGLLASGVSGAALIATDAIVATTLNLLKIGVFGAADLFTWRLVAIGAFVGAFTIPGAFIARALLARLSLKAHVWIMEALVIAGGLWFLYRGLFPEGVSR